MSAPGSRSTPGGEFPPAFPDDLRTDAPLGCIAAGGRTAFRLFAPRALSVTLVLFDRFEDDAGREVPMAPGPGGTWERTLEENLTGRWYGYRISGPDEPGGMFDPSILVADPYSRAVTVRNNWRLPAKTLILDDSFDWGDDRSPLSGTASDLVIYECHVRDLTAHRSAGARHPGTFKGLAEQGIAGGLGHILSLGVNAVELLPVMKFGTIEMPYRDESIRSDQGRVNDWNPYARNHWGYMTSFFFAPETYYGTDGTIEPGAVSGADGRAVRELKELVRALHREGIAVILDVVYNHTSHYDFNPFKHIDKQYYYRCDPAGNFLEESGCGNDFHTGRPMTRRLIADSAAYWLREYRVDGLRFDLAAMIDEETCRAITAAAAGVRPGVALIAEPWGGGRHHPGWFSELGWYSWNDRYRDRIKGRDPRQPSGFIFGGAGSAPDAAGALSGTPGPGDLPAPDGRFALNYVESHDGHTLGDFIRIATGEASPPRGGSGRLTPRQLALNRFAAMVLLSSPGPVMIHEGQEFARSKVIAKTDAPDPAVGAYDHNSYEKDNGTNYLDFGFADEQASLFGYYRQLILLRRNNPPLSTRRDPGSVSFQGEDGLLAVCPIPGDRPAGEGPNRYIVLLNASPDREAEYRPPPGPWTLLADASTVHPHGNGPPAPASVTLPPSSGMILGASQ